MNFRALSVSVAVVAAASVTPWVAVAAGEDPAARPLKAQAIGFTQGEVKRIDLERGKVTLRHGPIENLGMPGMTMVFRVDAPVLADLQMGEHIKFKADKIDGAMCITELDW